MLFRLAMALGKTVEELDTGQPAPLSAAEFYEWQAFYHFEPFGSPVEDQRAEILARLQWAPNFKGDFPETLFDRDHEETARLKAEREANMTLEDKIFAAMTNLM